MSLKVLACLGIFLVSVASKSCDSDPANPKLKGTFRNLTGLDGCGWIIELDDKSKIEPINLADFQVTAVDGKKVLVSFKQEDRASICMVGKVVKLLSVENAN